MEKAGGRPRDEVWQHVKILEGRRRVKCNYCGYEFAASANRIKSHINKDKGKGIRVCPNFPQSHNFASDNKRNSNHLKDNFLRSQGFSLDGLVDHRKSHEEGQIQGDAKYEERIQVGSSSVSNRENEYLQVLQYVFECLSPSDKVYDSGRLNLTQKEFITLKPREDLDSWVIDIFVEILTESERKKAIPSNWYLPVMFSTTALLHDEHNFEAFVHRHKMIENYIFDQESPEKVFIPVHTRHGPHGHFYLYIFHLNKKVVEIWDSLPIPVTETDRDETTKKLCFAMEILFKQKKGAFSDYQKEMANDIRSQDNGFDCGVFVINYMQQSDNYVKRDSSFQLDSQKEREDLALKLLNNDLNKEKKNLYDKARRHYAQVETQDGNKRLRVDDYNEEDDDSDEVDDDDSNEHGDGLENGMSVDSDEEDGDSDEDDDGLQNDLIQWELEIMKRIKDNKVSAIGVCGMGGSGKTFLASCIYKKLLEGGDIEVIWVTVSQNSISHLQKVIARSIRLDITGEFEVKRIARKIFQAFKEMKKCVVILDDVWDHFFLKDVGIPMSDNRIKLILTTRIQEVCQGMGCDQKNIIEVRHLEMDDSWALFKKTMGSYKGLSLEVKRIAKNVADECKGLPLAIVRIATSMKGKKQVKEWSHMLECLKNLDKGQYEMDKWVFPVLRSSYDFLSKKLQRFFLYCALSTNELFNLIGDDNLIRRFVYENIDETKNLRVQYDENYSMMNRLKNHSMLETRLPWEWEMNKFFRALAIGIAEDTSKIMANAYKNLKKIPSDLWKEDLQKAFLIGNKIKTIPNGTFLRCSQLSTLLLNDNANLNYISDDSFKNMPALKILDLSGTHIKRLPESMSNLKCLTALLLSKCRKLRYIPSLSKLKQLISLDLSDTAITKAPMGLESLVNLRCLCTYMLMSASLISKLNNLDNLEVIVAYFRDISIFNTYVSFVDENCVLASYHLILGDSRYVSPYKRITVKGLRDRKAVLPGDIEELVIQDCQLVGTVSSYLCSVVSSNGLLSLHQADLFSHLTLLKIHECNNMEILMTPELLALFRNLGTIDVSNCWMMKEIVGEDDHSKMELGGSGDLSHPTPITLPGLTSLKLDHMPQLNFVYRGVMLCPSLQTFSTFMCEILNHPRIEISNGCELTMEKTLSGYCWGIETD